MSLPNSTGLAGTFVRPPASPPTGEAPARAFGARLHRDLDELEPLWKAFEQHGAMTAYQRLDWIACIRDHLVAGSAVKPLYVEVFDPLAHETLMILPLAMERRFGARVITWLNVGVCDYAAPVCAAGLSMSEPEAIRAWAAVRAVLPSSDIIDITQIPSHVGSIVNPLALLPQGRVMTLTASGLEIGGGDAATCADRTRTDKELGKLRRRLARRGELRLVRAETEAQATTMFAVLVEQRRRRFKKLGRFDLLARADVRTFYREALLRSLGGRGPAQLWGLAVDGEWISTSYNLAHGGLLHGLILTTGDDSWKNCSPGLVMVSELMNRCVIDGHGYFDLTIGDLPYKAGFGAKPRPLRRLLDHQTLYGLAVLRTMQAVAGSKTWLESHPRMFEALRRARRGLRRTADRSDPA